MKRIIKYRVFTMILLIVLIFSEASVFAEVNPPADKVAGSGTQSDPYVLDFGASSSKRIVVDPKEIPFYFVVKGTGGVGGAFVIDYDVETGLVSFLLDRSVDASDGPEKASVYVTQAGYDTREQQIGVKYRVVSENKTSFPTYDIQEILMYNNTGKNKAIEGGTTITAKQRNGFLGIDFFAKDRYSVLRTLNLSNMGLQATYSDMARGDMYFFANLVDTKPQIDRLFSSSGYTASIDGKYWKYSKKDFKTVTIGDELTLDDGKIDFSIMYRFGGKSNSALNDSQATSRSIEAIFTRMLLVIGDDFLLKMLIQNLFGKDLTINSLIFNTYEDTKLEFYSRSTNKLSTSISNVVNTWYSIFSRLAYILYVIILVYIGVMIIASAGTPNQDKMKKSLGDWFVGLAIMLAVPTFVIPSLIKLNDAFVNFMYNKNSEQVTSYYSVYNSADDIIGGDSSTLSIEELLKKKNEFSDDLETKKKEKEKLLSGFVDGIVKETEKNSDHTVTDEEKDFLLKNYNSIYSSMKFYATSEFMKKAYTDDENFRETLKWTWYTIHFSGPPPAGNGTLDGSVIEASRDYFSYGSDKMKNMMNLFNKMLEIEESIQAIDQLIEVKSTDLMTVMRAYAGEYQRLVFAIVWFSLLFQLIALIFIYYKRIFVIAILIAIFPLIMIFYCIDKMADGSAQTLSMWFNELLSNIFIQSIHCIMYTVLVQMGLEIYKADPSNWFLFLAAMLLLVPAEKILREIFGLGGTTLEKLGGMGMKLGLGAIAAAKLFGKSLKGLGNKIAGKQDKAFVDKMNKKFDKTQRKQNRADEKAAIRANIRKAAGRTELSRMEKLREKAYSTATKAREFRAKNAPRAAKVARAAKNAAAMGAGVAYGIAVGGGTEGLTQGMQFADELMGSKGKMVSKKKANIKTELSSAYKRKAAKGKGKK